MTINQVQKKRHVLYIFIFAPQALLNFAPIFYGKIQITVGYDSKSVSRESIKNSKIDLNNTLPEKSLNFQGK